MSMTMERTLMALEQMSVGNLREKYEDLFHEPPRSWNRIHLVRRIAWRMQARKEGGLSERARQRALDLADESDLRTNAPKSFDFGIEGGSIDGILTTEHDSRIPMPGTIITRRYKGKNIKVRVLPKGFEHEGEIYTSLTALAQEITGSHWNGYDFFKLGKKEENNDKSE